MNSILGRIALVLLLALMQSKQAHGDPQRVDLIRVPNGGIQPQAAIDARGTIHLIYFSGDPEGGDIFYSRLAPGQAGFSAPIKVNTQPRSAGAIGSIRGAQLAVGRNGRIHVAWNGHAPKGRSYLEAPMLYTRLNDSGAAFEPERNVIKAARGIDGGGSVAADNQGNVYVTWHAPKPGAQGDEDDRAVFVVKSSDDGKAFSPEVMAVSKATGACACCGMKAFADASGDLFAFYRATDNLTNRDETLLMSRDHGMTYRVAYSHHWSVSTCPMSSFFLTETSRGILAAAETHGRVYYVRLDPNTGAVSDPVSPETRGKYPVAVGGADGSVLLVWTEGTAWAKGGALAWQMFDQNGNALSNPRKADGVAPWSFASAVAKPDGNFTIIY